jgi:regulatory protein
MKTAKPPFQYALDLIKIRDRSEFEIKKKMKDKDFLPEEIKKTLSFLVEKKFIDDRRFTEIYVRSQRSIGRNGKIKIRLKLKTFGISDELINEYLNTDSGVNNDSENANDAAEKWLRTKPNVPKEKIKEKLFRHLVGRGFEYEIIKEVINSRLVT